jgi:glucose-6-phosphate 1-dehydrogenase
MSTIYPSLEGEFKATSESKADPCSMVIFGAQGDLARRKLWPSLYNLDLDGLLPEQFSIFAISRRELGLDEVKEQIRSDLNEHSRRKPEDSMWEKFSERIHLFTGNLDESETYRDLKGVLQSTDKSCDTCGNTLYYLAIPPSAALPVVEKLGVAGLVEQTHDGPWTRVIFEKPFGTSLESAIELNENIGRVLDESQIYRIDHYLAKETIQNILVFRFTNSIFEPSWNRENIDNVQITMAEDIGVGSRGRFYEEVGVIRDVVQNHLLQVLGLIAMEPPVSMEADAIRDEKVKIFKSIRLPEDAEIGKSTILGQYEGYREGPGVAADSHVPTYAALKLHIDNWRWQGVPFYIRAGKGLNSRVTEVAIEYREPPVCLFSDREICEAHEPQVLKIRIQPHESIGLSFMIKPPGPGMDVSKAEMKFDYHDQFGYDIPDAYERVILNAMQGDATLFVRSDGVEATWQVVTPVLNYWRDNPPSDFPNYREGTGGPEAADEFIASDGRRWWTG